MAPKQPKKSAPNSIKKKAKIIKKGDNDESGEEVSADQEENTTDQNSSPTRRSSRLAGQVSAKTH